MFYEKDKAKEALEVTETMEGNNQIIVIAPVYHEPAFLAVAGDPAPSEQQAGVVTGELTEEDGGAMDTNTKVISSSQLKKLRQTKQKKKVKRLKKKRMAKGRF